MFTVLTVIIIITCLVLAFFILIQNPKGGGLSGSFGSMGAQVMGVKRSTDTMEKGTWVSIAIIAVLCIVCVVFYPKIQSQEIAPRQQQQQQQSSQPVQAPAQK